MEVSQSHPLILIVDDERPIRRLLAAALGEQDYQVNEAASAKEAISVAVDRMPDLVLLDLGLPDGDGQDLLSSFREWYSGPIIILSARDQEQQKIQALDSGADDYITKPFSTGELLARIRSQLRRRSRLATDETSLRFGDVEISFVQRTVTRAGQPVHLTPLEYKLLSTLVHNAGKVLTHRMLLREVWGPGNAEELHYVRVFVAGLRRKLEIDSARPQFILTEPGIGYRFVLAASE